MKYYRDIYFYWQRRRHSLIDRSECRPFCFEIFLENYCLSIVDFVVMASQSVKEKVALITGITGQVNREYFKIILMIIIKTVISHNRTDHTWPNSFWLKDIKFMEFSEDPVRLTRVEFNTSMPIPNRIAKDRCICTMVT